MRRSWWALAATVTACEGAGPDLLLEFPDPVVEARARAVLVQVLQARTCLQVYDLAASEVSQLGPSIEQRVVGTYPVRPSEVLPDGISGTGVIHVATRDDQGRVLARGCAEFTPEAIPEVIVLRALPPCAETPTAPDVAIVFDASDEMRFADSAFGGVAPSFVAGFLDAADFPPGSRFSLYAFGAAPVGPAIVTSDDADMLATEILDLEEIYGGPPDLFAGIAQAAHDLRDRAACPRLPVVVALVAGDSIGGQPSGAFAVDAAFSLFAAQGDREDDVFAFGVGLSEAAIDDLSASIPEGVGQVRGARTSSTLRAALEEASFAIRSRVNLP